MKHDYYLLKEKYIILISSSTHAKYLEKFENNMHDVRYYGNIDVLVWQIEFQIAFSNYFKLNLKPLQWLEKILTKKRKIKNNRILIVSKIFRSKFFN